MGVVRPLELERERGRTMLVLEDPGGEPLHRLRLRLPMELGQFLRTCALPLPQLSAKLHQRGLVHKDIKPANILDDAPPQARGSPARHRLAQPASGSRPSPPR